MQQPRERSSGTSGVDTLPTGSDWWLDAAQHPTGTGRIGSTTAGPVADRWCGRELAFCSRATPQDPRLSPVRLLPIRVVYPSIRCALAMRSRSPSRNSGSCLRLWM